MPTAAPIQASFNAGEFGPLVYGRVDYPKYANGVSLMQNFIPLVQGPATRRTGSVYAASTRGNAAGRLVPFVFSSGDAFMLEFTDAKLRFYRNRAPVYEAAQDIASVTKADPCVVEYVGADNYSNGDEVALKNITGMTELNGRRFLVSNVDTGAKTFEITDLGGTDIDSTGYTTYVSGGTIEKVYEITSPYAIADVVNLRFLQSRDVVYIAHPDYEPRKLSRTAVTSWSFATVDFSDGPYQKINDTATTLTPSATTGSVTVTASSTTGINGGSGFVSTDVGRKIRIKHSTTWGWGTITAVGSTTSVTVDVDGDAPFGGTGAVKVWRLGEWSETTGYPSIVFSFEDRVGWGASPAEPVTLSLSKTGDYENMAPTDPDSTVTADAALQLKANQKRQDPIRWVFDDEKGLVAGTKGAEFLARASTTGEAMSAINFPALRRSTKWGSAFIEPIEAGKSILFVQSSKRKMRELAFVFEVDGFRAPDMTVISSHATKRGIAEMAYQKEPYSIIWVRMDDGSLWGLTYDREQDVIAWHRHVVGGYANSGKTEPAYVEAVAAMPSPDGTQDDLWMLVKRYVDGGVKRYVEYLSEFNEAYDGVEDCYFVDCGITFEPGSPTSTITGLDHLEGEEVSLLVDGKPTPNKTVSGGTITSDIEVQTKAHVGFNFTSRIKTLRPEAGAENGTAQGKTKKTHKLIGRFHETVGIWVGRDFTENGGKMDPVDFRAGNHTMGAAVPLYSGDMQLDYEDDYNTDGYVCLETRQPLPCTLLALMPQLKTEDGR